MSSAYELRIGGHLEGHWSAALGTQDLHHRPDGTTTFTVRVADQAQLHGVLAMLRDIGAPLLSLQVLSVAPLAASGATSPSGIRPRP